MCECARALAASLVVSFGGLTKHPCNFSGPRTILGRRLLLTAVSGFFVHSELNDEMVGQVGIQTSNRGQGHTERSPAGLRFRTRKPRLAAIQSLIDQ